MQWLLLPNIMTNKQEKWSGKPEEKAKSRWQPNLPTRRLQSKHWWQGEVAGDMHGNELQTKHSHWQLITASFKSKARHLSWRRRAWLWWPHQFLCLVSRLHHLAVLRSLIVRGVNNGVFGFVFIILLLFCLCVVSGVVFVLFFFGYRRNSGRKKSQTNKFTLFWKSTLLLMLGSPWQTIFS